jgi:hypothetical protein
VVGVTLPDVAGFGSRAAALAYLAAGLMPVPWRVKGGKDKAFAIGKNMQHGPFHADELVVTEELITTWRWPAAGRGGVGLLTSKSSGLIVIDIDDRAAFRSWVAETGLDVPATAWSSTGRKGGGSHLLFDGRELPEDEWPRQGTIWPGRALGEIKSRGFVAVEPSLHPAGLPYTWRSREVTPLMAPEAAGLRAWFALRTAELDRKEPSRREGGEGSQVERWVAGGIQESGGGAQRDAFLKITTALARRGLDDAAVVAACLGIAAMSPSDPRRPWAAADFREMLPGARRLIEQADKAAAAAADDPDDLPVVTLSDKKQESKTVNAVVPSPGDPMAVARVFVKRSLLRGLPTLVSWRGDFYRWDGSQWNEADIKIIRDEIYHWLEFARYWKPRATKSQPDLKPALEPWAPSVITVNRVADALAAVVTLPWDTEPGMWLVPGPAFYRSLLP